MGTQIEMRVGEEKIHQRFIRKKPPHHYCENIVNIQYVYIPL